MQPFQQTASPSSESTIGCAAAPDSSMIVRRRWPRATAPCDHTPAAPRRPRAIPSAMAETALISGVWPSRRTSPAAPHIQSTLPAGGYSETSRPGNVQRLRNALQLFGGFVDLLDRPLEPVLHRHVPVDVQQDQHATDEQRGVVHELPLEAPA